MKSIQYLKESFSQIYTHNQSLYNNTFNTNRESKEDNNVSDNNKISLSSSSSSSLSSQSSTTTIKTLLSPSRPTISRENSSILHHSISSLFSSSIPSLLINSTSLYTIQKETSSFLPNTNSSLKQTLQKIAVNNTIIVTLVDQSDITSFMKFYDISIKANNITNFLPFVYNEDTQKILRSSSLVTSKLTIDSLYFSNSSYDVKSREFDIKSNLKVLPILYCLSLGYHVLYTDIDYIFFKNPLFYINTLSDISFPVDYAFTIGKQLDNGLLYVRNSFSGIAVLLRSWKSFLAAKGGRQQLHLKNAITVYKNSTNVEELNSVQFQNGYDFFVSFPHHFIKDIQNTKIVAVHHNYIYGDETKEYQIKELGLYNQNINMYYQNSSEQFVSYINNKPLKEISSQSQQLQFMFFMSFLLNRTLVLPSFTCLYSKKTILIKLHTLCDLYSKQQQKSLFKNSLLSPVLLRELYTNTSNFMKSVEMDSKILNDTEFIKKYTDNHMSYTCAYNGNYCVNRLEKFLHNQYKEHSIIIIVIIMLFNIYY
ncbi:hypothetical protein WA158_005218 [Blastocystis sp. Blastoise]